MKKILYSVPFVLCCVFAIITIITYKDLSPFNKIVLLIVCGFLLFICICLIINWIALKIKSINNKKVLQFGIKNNATIKSAIVVSRYSTTTNGGLNKYETCYMVTLTFVGDNGQIMHYKPYNILSDYELNYLCKMDKINILCYKNMCSIDEHLELADKTTTDFSALDKIKIINGGKKKYRKRFILRFIFSTIIWAIATTLATLTIVNSMVWGPSLIFPAFLYLITTPMFIYSSVDFILNIIVLKRGIPSFAQSFRLEHSHHYNDGDSLDTYYCCYSFSTKVGKIIKRKEIVELDIYGELSKMDKSQLPILIYGKYSVIDYSRLTNF